MWPKSAHACKARGEKNSDIDIGSRLMIKGKISILRSRERLKKSSRDKGKESIGERSGLCHQPSRTALHTYHKNFVIQTPRS